MEDGAGPPEHKHQVTNGLKNTSVGSYRQTVYFDKILILSSKYKKRKKSLEIGV